MLKDIALDELAKAIRALADNRTAFQPAMTESLMSAIRRGGDTDLIDLDRELLSAGRSMLVSTGGGHSTTKLCSTIPMSR